jgi:hypothetical protein
MWRVGCVAVATAAREHRPTPQERATASTQYAFSRKAGRLRLGTQKGRPALSCEHANANLPLFEH